MIEVVRKTKNHYIIILKAAYQLSSALCPLYRKTHALKGLVRTKRAKLCIAVKTMATLVTPFAADTINH